MSNQRMPDARKAELRALATQWVGTGAVVSAASAGIVYHELLDALEMSDAKLTAFDALAKQYDIEGDESSAETFERTLRGLTVALSGAREKLAEAAEARAADEAARRGEL